MMAGEPEQPENWTESQVSSWLRAVGVKEQYVKKLYEEDVNGPVLLTLMKDYLREEIGMKSGPALLLINKRDELIKGPDTTPDQQKTLSFQKSKKGIKSNEQKSSQCLPGGNEGKPVDIVEADQAVLSEKQTGQEHSVCVLPTKEDCRPRPFDKEAIDFTYVKHRVLEPESGVFDLINPCHEYKSFATAVLLDRARLQAKFAKEVLKFGTGCMNMRSNGTIHFGVMDSRDDAGYTHGEIIGVPVKEKDMYVDALDLIERSFSPSDSEHVRQCIRPPRFIEVIDRTSSEKSYVIEVDIVPSVSIVNGRVYSVSLPNFKANKFQFEKGTIYRRVGSKSETVIDKDQSDFYHRARDRDAQRKEAENCQSSRIPDICQDLKLTLAKRQELRVEYGKNDEICNTVKMQMQLMDLAHSVCQVRVEGTGRGSGFLLFDQFILTNAHVIKDLYNDRTKQLTQNVTVSFCFLDLEIPVDSVQVKPEVVVFNYNRYVETGFYYDWALLELHSGLAKNIPCGLLGHFATPPQKGGICIIGHPDGGVKKTDTCLTIPGDESETVALDRYKADQHLVTKQFFDRFDVAHLKNQRTDLYYDSCFFYGSSGSPVFDEFCNVVAMHTGGYVYETKHREGQTQSFIEYAQPLSRILPRIIIHIVERQRFDVLEAYLHYTSGHPKRKATWDELKEKVVMIGKMEMKPTVVEAFLEMADTTRN